MRTALVALLTLSACWSKSSSSTTPSNTAATTGAPGGPVPIVAFGTSRFATPHLPAVSQDGSRVLLAIQDHDGGRGFPNLRLEVRDRDDKILATHVVLSVEQADGYLQEPEVQDKIKPRLAQANAWLAEQHRALAFIPLTMMTVDRPSESDSALPQERLAQQRTARGADHSLAWDGTSVNISDASTKLLERKTPGAWLAESHDMGDGFVCHNPAYVEGASIDPAHRVAVLVVGYTGTDTCWEPNFQHHVIAW